ncbi:MULTISPECIES: MFS transporter [unclassified Microbacterium]|uniref:MFS transporter n=1 Tax=unclassified Microbacterium TaxID=2609290 RepID=UPI00214B4595|nr:MULTISPECIES: MFS transporter [unclassified Microbacterium]MCR2810403.1 MFS transporter [Microbacterium sp. zg.B185]WIM18459.1 MFS transporter [Microbacterium sp. zg-B185]
MSTPPVSALRSRAAVSAAYAAQGFGYAVVVTSLPVFKDRQGIDDVGVSLIVLLVCVTAAVGSIIADVLAKWRGSRVALSVALAFEVLALVAIVLTALVPGLALWVFVAAFGIYGIGLGGVDAAGAMQGVLVQRRYGRDIMGGYFAAYTAAAIVGALAVAGSTAVGLAVVMPLTLAAIVASAVALLGAGAFDPARAAAPVGRHGKAPLPRRGIWLFGFVLLAAFTVDSAVSTWSTVYLQDQLLTAGALAPLGYAAYQAAILVTRLLTDPAVGRFGRTRVVLAAAVISLLGCGLVALLPFPVAAIGGFALAGVAVGALVPLTFTSAGALAPARSDEIIARVNLFNYVGAVLGAVMLGLLADSPGLGVAFLLPAALLVPVLLTARRFRAPVALTSSAPLTAVSAGGEAAASVDD